MTKNEKDTKYGLLEWKNILFSLAFICVMFLYVMVVASKGFIEVGLYLDATSIIIVLGFGLTFQFLCHGTSILFNRGRKVNDAVFVMFSTQFFTGVLIGGLFTSISGLTLIFADLSDISWIGINMGIAFISILYLLIINLRIKLNYIKKIKKTNQYDLIAPFSKFEILKMTLLFFMIIVLIAISITVILGGIERFKSLQIDFKELLSHGFIVYLSSFILLTVIFRVLFTFKELWSALGYFFMSLSGSEVDVKVRNKSAGILRFVTETFMICIFTTGLIRLIGLMSNLETAHYVFNYFFNIFVCCLVAFLIYMVLNLIISRFLVRSHGSIESNLFLMDNMVTFYKHNSKNKSRQFWTETLKGKIKIVISILLFVTVTILGFYVTRASVFSRAGILGVITILILICLSFVHIRKIKLVSFHNI